MSMMKCDNCEVLIDTDSDPESLYVVDIKCFCLDCRDSKEVESEVRKHKYSGEFSRAQQDIIDTWIADAQGAEDYQ